MYDKLSYKIDKYYNKDNKVTAQTNVYLYNQRQLVVLLQRLPDGAKRSYEKVYSKNLTISRGVDNLIEFAFVNQNQKPVDISDIDITCRILNANGTEILLQKTLTAVLPITGLTSLSLTKEEIENINTQYCYYTLEIPVDDFDYPVFVDSQGGARGVINIVNSVLPSFVPSDTVTIPSHVPPLSSGDSVTYYSSYINTVESPLISLQVTVDNFTGNIQWQGSTLADFSLWYTLSDVTSYSEETTTDGFNIAGYHPYIRLMIVNEGTYPVTTGTDYLQGDVTQILAR